MGTAYPITPFGQQEALEDMLSVAKNGGYGRGVGTFCWEPGWYPINGAGVRGGQGNVWGNRTQVDYHGNTPSSMSLYRRY